METRESCEVTSPWPAPGLASQPSDQALPLAARLLSCPLHDPVCGSVPPPPGSLAERLCGHPSPSVVTRFPKRVSKLSTMYHSAPVRSRAVEETELVSHILCSITHEGRLVIHALELMWGATEIHMCRDTCVKRYAYFYVCTMCQEHVVFLFPATDLLFTINPDPTGYLWRGTKLKLDPPTVSQFILHTMVWVVFDSLRLFVGWSSVVTSILVPFRDAVWKGRESFQGHMVAEMFRNIYQVPTMSQDYVLGAT